MRHSRNLPDVSLKMAMNYVSAKLMWRKGKNLWLCIIFLLIS